MFDRAFSAVFDRNPLVSPGGPLLVTGRIASCIVIVAALASASQDAAARPSDDKICFAQFRGRVSPADMIAACSGVIASTAASASERSQAYANRAAAKMFANDHAAAEADLTKALELDPENASALANRGSIKMNRGDVDGAIQDYDNAIRHEPAFANAYLNRGLAWLAKRQYQRAVADLTYAIKNTSVRAAVFLARSRAHFALGDGDGALDDLNRGLRVGDTTRIRAARCQLKAILNTDLSGAEADCAAALERKPGDGDVLVASAHLAFRRGQFETALSSLTLATSAGPHSEEAQFLRAVAFSRLGRPDNAALATLRAKGSDIEQIYARYGIMP